MTETINIAATEKRPAEFYTKRACKCGQCGNRINSHNLAARVNGRIVCEGCASLVRWNAAHQRWEWIGK